MNYYSVIALLTNVFFDNQHTIDDKAACTEVSPLYF